MDHNNVSTAMFNTASTLLTLEDVTGSGAMAGAENKSVRVLININYT